ncbi:hypothetical protein H1C71_012766 [Ictidomys tridecemlineatus]|nr:hypothetical protein H1C71_012766 [Ictidomys tridecemlineatus]
MNLHSRLPLFSPIGCRLLPSAFSGKYCSATQESQGTESKARCTKIEHTHVKQSWSYLYRIYFSECFEVCIIQFHTDIGAPYLRTMFFWQLEKSWKEPVNTILSDPKLTKVVKFVDILKECPTGLLGLF